MKKSVMLCCLVLSMGCAKPANDPAEQALVRMNGAVAAGRVDVFLQQLAPGTLRDVGARLGLGQETDVEAIMKRLVLVPGMASEKLRSFRPRVIRERTGPTEKWYRLELGGRKLQVPVRKFGDRWRVALNEALIDSRVEQDD